MADETTDCFGYVRISSDDRYQTGAGRGAQVYAIEECAKRNGWRLIKIFEESEGVSGETPEDRRPGLMDALDALRPGSVLVVAKRDRLMRDNIRIALLEAVIRKRKCRLVSAAGEGTDTIDPNDPSAFLQKSIVDLFATYELQLIRVRTRLALRSKQRRGERTGRLPYGFDVDPGDPRRSRPSNDRHGQPAGNKPIVLVQNPAELDILARMMKLRARGWTFDRITWALGRHGILTKNGKPWGRSSVRHVLIAIEADPCHPVHEILRSSQAVSPSPTSSES